MWHTTLTHPLRLLWEGFWRPAASQRAAALNATATSPRDGPVLRLAEQMDVYHTQLFAGLYYYKDMFTTDEQSELRQGLDAIAHVIAAMRTRAQETP